MRSWKLTQPYRQTDHKHKVKEFRKKESPYQITLFIPYKKERSYCLLYQHVTKIKTCLAQALTFFLTRLLSLNLQIYKHYHERDT